MQIVLNGVRVASRWPPHIAVRQTALYSPHTQNTAAVRHNLLSPFISPLGNSANSDKTSGKDMLHIAKCLRLRDPHELEANGVYNKYEYFRVLNICWNVLLSGGFFSTYTHKHCSWPNRENQLSLNGSSYRWQIHFWRGKTQLTRRVLRNYWHYTLCARNGSYFEWQYCILGVSSN